MESLIPFNKPYSTGTEIDYIADAIKSSHLSGNGKYTKKCQAFFEQNFGIKKALLTTSCTDALEMTALLANIKDGDEVIMPSYTFVSTALAFVRQGAKIIFADSYSNHPNIDANKIENLITPKTKVIVPVHYAGMACDMDKIMLLAKKYNLIVIEDAAQAFDSYYIGKDGIQKPLGSIGHMATFSFHETKNIISGEGGLLAINDEQFIERSEIIWEKGTNRSAFFRGEINKYGWVDIGSSFLPSEIIAAFLWSQLENFENIQNTRKLIWNKYNEELSKLNLKGVSLPNIPTYSTNNAHMFYFVTDTKEQRKKILFQLKQNGIHAVFHYISLHSSPFYKNLHSDRKLPNADKFTNNLIRLPLYYELTENEIIQIVEKIKNIYN